MAWMSWKPSISWRNGLPSSRLTPIKVRSKKLLNIRNLEKQEEKGLQVTRTPLPKKTPLVCFPKTATWMWGKPLLLFMQMLIHNFVLTITIIQKGEVLLVWIGKMSHMQSLLSRLEFGCNFKCNKKDNKQHKSLHFPVQCCYLWLFRAVSQRPVIVVCWS